MKPGRKKNGKWRAKIYSIRLDDASCRKSWLRKILLAMSDEWMGLYFIFLHFNSVEKEVFFVAKKKSVSLNFTCYVFRSRIY